MKHRPNLFLVEPPAEVSTRDEHRHSAMLTVLRIQRRSFEEMQVRLRGQLDPCEVQSNADPAAVRQRRTGVS